MNTRTAPPKRYHVALRNGDSFATTATSEANAIAVVREHVLADSPVRRVSIAQATADAAHLAQILDDAIRIIESRITDNDRNTAVYAVTDPEHAEAITEDGITARRVMSQLIALRGGL